MKKYSIALALLVYSATAWSCDVCGCTSMGFGLGNWAVNGQSTVGLRYSLRSFKGPEYTDHFHQTEVWGIYALSSRFSLMGAVPYLQATRQLAPGQTGSLNGLGDATLLANYQFLQTRQGNWAHTASAAAGLNLPTGTFENRENSLLAPNFQTGTGSFDFTVQGQYRLNYLENFLVLQGQYLWNTTNRYDYKFGNQFMANLRLGRAFETEQFKLLIFAGSGFENYARDVNSRNFYQYGTGGQVATTGIGFNFFWQHFWLGAEANTTVWQSLNSNYTPQTQVQINLNYLF